MLLHATCVTIGRRGVLLRGKPGSGKSDLALRLIDQPGYGLGHELLRSELVGDDQIILTRKGDAIFAAPAQSLAGLLEIRGTGIVDCPHAGEAQVHLVVDLVAHDSIERIPEAESAQVELLGVSIAKIAVDASKPSAVARVRAGLPA